MPTNMYGDKKEWYHVEITSLIKSPNVLVPEIFTVRQYWFFFGGNTFI
jgi:hypothetical protein